MKQNMNKLNIKKEQNQKLEIRRFFFEVNQIKEACHIPFKKLPKIDILSNQDEN